MNLTHRQEQLLQLHCLGFTYAEIPGILHLSPATLKNYRCMMYRANGWRNITQAVYEYWRNTRVDKLV